MSVRLATEKDLPGIRAFIESHWKRGHILARDENFFRYQYGAEEGRINFVIAQDGSEITAVLGFIPSRTDRKHIWLALWKAKESNGASRGFDGLACYHHLLEQVQPEEVTCPGINRQVARLYERLGFMIGELEQLYVMNPELSDYRLVEFQGDMAVRDAGAGRLRVLDRAVVCKMLRLFGGADGGRKDEEYYVRRFLEHPIYRYEALGIEGASEGLPVGGILFGRVTEAAGAKALRLVDFVGREEALKGVGGLLQRWIMEQGCEFADFHQYGLPEEIVRQSGMSINRGKPGVVVPSYFEPFEKKNVKILFAAKVVKPLRMFKADGDQDRPS